MLLILGGICAHISCNSINNFPFPGTTSNTPTEIKQNVNSVVVEICIIPIAPHQNELLQQLWRELDEQSLPPQLRRELHTQGFRAGILGNLISPALAQLLNISSEASASTPWGEMQEISVAEAAREPMTTRHLRTLLPGMSAIIKVFGDNAVMPELSLFWNENGMFGGRTYYNALGLIFISAVANRDGSAQIQIVPELEHGFMEHRIRTVSGMVVQESGRPRHTFESLTISQRLLPGQWLIMGATALDSPGAGKAFFSRRTSAPEQRILAIRLVNVTVDSSPSSLLPVVPRGTEAIVPERNYSIRQAHQQNDIVD